MVDDRIGLILHERGDGTEELLMQFAFDLLDKGVNVGGLVQRSVRGPTGKNIMDLIDIRTKDEFRISQDLGAGSDACSLDPAGLAEASQVLRREIESGVALLVVNKFSGAECSGEGLAAETFEAIAQGIPVITSLAVRYQDDWNLLTESAGTLLQPNLAALWSWWTGLTQATALEQEIQL